MTFCLRFLAITLHLLIQQQNLHHMLQVRGVTTTESVDLTQSTLVTLNDSKVLLALFSRNISIDNTCEGFTSLSLTEGSNGNLHV